MNYPNITQYKEAIEFSEDTLKELSHLEPVRRANGELYFSSGNFAVVFKLYDPEEDTYFALKCFLRDAPERKARYVHTHAYISQLNCPYLLACDFLEDEIYADDRELEVLCMEWVEGKLLGVLIRELCEAGDHTGLEALYQQFKIMALNISQLDFAHGDIKHDNVIVTESFGYQYTLKLIDYDGMYVPALHGQQAQELGGKSYQHPLRDASHFDKDLDSFSVYLILLSLAVLRERPEWYEVYNSGENILFSQADLLDWENSKLVNIILKELNKDSEVSKWLERISIMLKYNKVADCNFYTALTRNPKGIDIPHKIAMTVKGESALIDLLIDDMVFVEGGTFWMGATKEQDDDAWGDEYPIHKVCVSDFRIAKFQVSQELWIAIMDSNPSSFINLKAPVDSVTWKDCILFIDKLNKKTGRCFSLPTEAQWEFAARGGNHTQFFQYSGSSAIEDIAWYTLNSFTGTKPIGMKKSNELGLYDMSGNVWEWCLDSYTLYKNTYLINPIIKDNTGEKVLRGGGWNSGKGHCRISARLGLNPLTTYNYIGIRLVENI